MDTTFLLNHYRLSIVDDSLAVQLLSRLYRDGPQTETELSRDLNTADKELREELTKLYRANFVRIITPEKWGVTELSEDVLTRLGIGQAASKSLLAAQRLPRPDLIFLNACIEAKENDYRLSRQQMALLKSLSNVVSVLQSKKGQRETDTTRLVYAMIVGLDPDVQRLGEKDYCRLVVERHDELKHLERGWRAKCLQATKDVHSSNHFFLYGAPPEQADWHLTCSLTWSRLLSTFLTENGDDGLRTAFLAKKEMASQVWNPLRLWLSDIDERSFQFLTSTGKLKRQPDSDKAGEPDESKRVLLDMMLLQILMRSMRERYEEEFGVERFLLDPKQELSDSHQLLSMMRMLSLFKSELEAGRYRSVIASERERLCELLNSLVVTMNTQGSDRKEAYAPSEIADENAAERFTTSAVAASAKESARAVSVGMAVGQQGFVTAVRKTVQDSSILSDSQTPVGDYPKVSYDLPSSEYLAPAPVRSEVPDEDLLRTAKEISETIKKLRVPGEIKYICPGPVVTTYEFKPDPGVKYSRVSGLVDDLRRAMKAQSTWIDRMPGKPHVAIEMPNTRREVIYLSEVIESRAFKESSSKLTIALGKTIDGLNYVSDLTKMPHLLIAGSAGSGKSVGLNALLVSILYRARPDEVKLVLIDSNGLALRRYEGIPHLLTRVIVDPKPATRALRWAVAEMERRYRELASWGVRNIDAYNAERERRNAVKDFDENDEPWTRTPYIVIVIDELADLMMTSGHEVEDSITRLAQMARAVGIHLVLSTEHPSVDVVTGLIKANFPSRICYRVSSVVESRAILETSGAEQLLGRGDMLFLPPGASRLLRIHGAYVDQREVTEIAAHARKQCQPVYNERIAQFDGELTESSGQRDELFEEALRICVEMKRASTSVLQRRLRIGYGRAASLLDAMEAEGLVGKAKGAQPRTLRKKAYDAFLPTNPSLPKES
jgi:hypothetical protein